MIKQEKQRREAVGSTYPLVLHGAASLPKESIDEVNKWGGKVEQLMMCTEETISKTAKYGIAKANMDVDNMLAYTGAVRKFLTEKPEQYNHLLYINQATAAFKKAVKHKMHSVTMSSGFGDKFMKELD
ncbi:MAG: class II fructose-bisphosphate aldolase [Petrimonas sp.]|nr:class II fructose-bisphosphate aldolase [Petrimonas sp.]